MKCCVESVDVKANWGKQAWMNQKKSFPVAFHGMCDMHDKRKLPDRASSGICFQFGDFASMQSGSFLHSENLQIKNKFKLHAMASKAVRCLKLNEKCVHFSRGFPQSLTNSQWMIGHGTHCNKRQKNPCWNDLLDHVKELNDQLMKLANFHLGDNVKAQLTDDMLPGATSSIADACLEVTDATCVTMATMRSMICKHVVKTERQTNNLEMSAMTILKMTRQERSRNHCQSHVQERKSWSGSCQ